MNANTATISSREYSREEAKSMGPYLVPPSAQSLSTLFLSAVDRSDMPEMLRILNLDDSVFQGSSGFLFPYLQEHAEAHIERAYNVVKKCGMNTHWAMRTAPNGKLVGWIHIHTHRHDQPLSLQVKEGRSGYWVSPEYRGQGFAVRSLQFLLTEIAVKEMDYDLIKADAFVDNLASRKVMERAGMVLESEELVVKIENFGGLKKRIATYVWHSPRRAVSC
ncbi:hypothetical protein BGX28_002274 [Mortierella sp. GBA30]|nr:hypothetical protein BGX28_002274 [Mortierella sp. GBA30]